MLYSRRNSKVGMSESIFSKSMHVASVVAAYWFVSISMVFLNKYLLSSTDVRLDAPLFITWFQCVVAVVLSYILSIAAKLFPSYISFPEFKIEIQTVKQVMPLSVVFVLMITCNNLCLMYVGVAFYYVVRSLTTIFNVVLSYIILRQTTSCRAMACCGIIIAGFGLGVNMEKMDGSLSVWGVIYGVGASLFVALNAIYTKKVLPAVGENIWRLSIYNNLNACFLFLPLMEVAGEFSVVYNFSKIRDFNFWSFMVIGGIFGFAIGYVTGLQIQVTSPLTHNISGTAKAAAQTVIATIYYNDVKSFLWWFSNVVVLLGSAAYTQVKRMEMMKDFESKKRIAEELLTGEKSDDSSVKVNILKAVRPAYTDEEIELNALSESKI